MSARREDTVFNPQNVRAYLAGRIGKAETKINVPADIVFTYDPRIFGQAITQSKAAPVDWYTYEGRLCLGNIGSKQVGIVHGLLGAAAAVMNLEELIAYGAKRVFELGVSGGIGSALSPGDLVVLKGAFSDEGTSKHYFRGKTWFESSRSLSQRLERSFREENVKFVWGDAWTTDAPYRETKEKVVRYRKIGAQVVNMESSAIFAIAAYRQVEAASVQIVSDIVSEKGWEPSFYSELVKRRRQEVVSAVLQTIKTNSELKPINFDTARMPCSCT
jgi:uridine phosphorylase